MVLTFTNMGFDVVVSDVDTVWLQNPLPYLANYPDADILVSSDSLVSSASAQFDESEHVSGSPGSENRTRQGRVQ